MEFKPTTKRKKEESQFGHTVFNKATRGQTERSIVAQRGHKLSTFLAMAWEDSDIARGANLLPQSTSLFTLYFGAFPFLLSATQVERSADRDASGKRKKKWRERERES